MKVEIWSDVVCPWCYVGKRRFEAALARFPHRDEVEVLWRSFELDPSASGTASGDYAERLAAKYGRTVPQAQEMLDSMTATAAEEGLVFDFSISRAGATFDAHRLLHAAAAQGLQGALKERLLRATFTEGEAIAEHDVLLRLAADVGMTGAAEVLASDAHADAVRQDEAQAAAYGARGVPFFVVDGRYGVSGAQPADALLDVLQRAWAESRPALTTVTAGGPGCDGPSCDGPACDV